MVHGILFSLAFGSGLWVAFQCGRAHEQDRFLTYFERRKAMKRETDRLWDEFKRTEGGHGG